MNFLICTPAANAVVDASAETKAESEEAGAEAEADTEKPMPRESQAGAFLVRRISFSWALPNIYRWRKPRRGPPGKTIRVLLLLWFGSFFTFKNLPSRSANILNLFSVFFVVVSFCCCVFNVCMFGLLLIKITMKRVLFAFLLDWGRWILICRNAHEKEPETVHSAGGKVANTLENIGFVPRPGKIICKQQQKNYQLEISTKNTFIFNLINRPIKCEWLWPKINFNWICKFEKVEAEPFVWS